MTSSTPILGYWNIRGLAQPIRYLLEFAGVKYEEKLYEYADWPICDKSPWLKVKPNMELDFPNLPYYIDQEVKLTQSDVIIRYLAKKYNLIGKTELEQVRCELLASQLRDYLWEYFGVAYNPKFEELKEEYIEKLKDNLKGLDKFLGDNKYVVGDYVTYADFLFFEYLEGQCFLVQGLLNDYPKLKAYYERVASLEAIDNYFKSPRAIKFPFNGARARFGGKYSEQFKKMQD